MRKIAPLHFKLIFENSEDGDKRLKRAYRRIFEIATKNILYRRRQGNMKLVIDKRC